MATPRAELYGEDGMVGDEEYQAGYTAAEEYADEEEEGMEEDTSYFGLLPEEVLVYLVGFMDGREVLRLQCVSKRFRRVAADERVWARLCWRDFKMRYLTSRALWINYTRGSSSSSSNGRSARLPYFPFSNPTTPYTIAPPRHLRLQQ